MFETVKTGRSVDLPIIIYALRFTRSGLSSYYLAGKIDKVIFYKNF